MRTYSREKISPRFRQHDQFVGDRIHFDFAAMQDDERRAEPLREIDRLEGLLDGALAFLRIGRGELVAIGRRLHDLDGERTEVVQAGELHFAGLEHFLNPRHERNADAVAQFDAIEAEILDLAQHFVAGGVPAGVPAGGEGDHGGICRI